MRIDLTGLLEGKTSEIAIEYSFVPGEDGVRLPHGITLSAPIRVTGRVKDNHGYMTLTASAVADYETVCDRCLAPISTSLSFSIERLIEAKGTHAAPDGLETDDEDILSVVNGAVDIDGELTEALTLELPMRHLCDENCPGLCPKCGKRLAEGDCSCQNEKEIDPRLKVLQKLLEKPQ